MIPLLVAVVLGLLALAYVLYPLYRPRLAAQEAERSDQNREKEQNARSALQEVEFDFQLGNLAEADYKDLRERYMQRAVGALKARYEREQQIDEEIEQELRKLKGKDEKAE
jgi:predicted HTH transcriptional regulator